MLEKFTEMRPGRGRVRVTVTLLALDWELVLLYCAFDGHCTAGLLQ